MSRPSATILFQGDSITDAFRKPEESNLCFRLGSGYAFLGASGIIHEHPEWDLKFFNRGVSGNTYGGILSRWRTDALDLRPDVISLLAGVNDTMCGTPLEETEGACREILRLTREVLPATRIVLIEPFLLPVAQITADNIRNLQDRCAVIRRAAGDFGLTPVRLQPLLDAAAEKRPASDLSYDGIHASPVGAVLLAQAWRDAVFPLIRSCLEERSPAPL